MLDGLKDHEGSSLGVVEASRSILASAKAQKLVERAVLAIAVLESGQQFWSWRTVCKCKITKFCMSLDNAMATIHLTLSTNICTNQYASYPTLRESWRLLKLHQFFELVQQVCLAPSRAEYTRRLLKTTSQRPGESVATFGQRVI